MAHTPGAPFAEFGLAASTLYAVPFNQIRAVTVSKMLIFLTQLGGAGRTTDGRATVGGCPHGMK